MLPAVNEGHVWVMTKNVEIFGVLNPSLVFTEEAANLGLQPVLGEMSDDSMLLPKGFSLHASLVYLCLLFLIPLSICIDYSVIFQLSGLLSSRPSSSAVSHTVQMLFSKLFLR